MTTGSNFNTQFISMRPDENTRSIIELLEEEESNGYSNMSDIEISNLIEYKEHKAKTSEETNLKKIESLERLNIVMFEEAQRTAMLESELKNTQPIPLKVINFDSEVQ